MSWVSWRIWKASKQQTAAPNNHHRDPPSRLASGVRKPRWDGFSLNQPGSARGGVQNTPKTAQNHPKRCPAAPAPEPAGLGGFVRGRYPLGQHVGCVGYLFAMFGVVFMRNWCPPPPQFGPVWVQLSSRETENCPSRARHIESQFLGHVFHVPTPTSHSFHPLSLGPNALLDMGFAH